MSINGVVAVEKRVSKTIQTNQRGSNYKGLNYNVEMDIEIDLPSMVVIYGDKKNIFTIQKEITDSIDKISFTRKFKFINNEEKYGKLIITGKDSVETLTIQYVEWDYIFTLE